MLLYTVILLINIKQHLPNEFRVLFLKYQDGLIVIIKHI